MPTAEPQHRPAAWSQSRPVSGCTFSCNLLLQPARSLYSQKPTSPPALPSVPTLLATLSHRSLPQMQMMGHWAEPFHCLSLHQALPYRTPLSCPLPKGSHSPSHSPAPPRALLRSVFTVPVTTSPTILSSQSWISSPLAFAGFSASPCCHQAVLPQGSSSACCSEAFAGEMFLRKHCWLTSSLPLPVVLHFRSCPKAE